MKMSSEGTGGGLTNASRGMAGGYGGLGFTSQSAKTNPRLTGDAHLYDYKNQHVATMNALTQPAPNQAMSTGGTSSLGFDPQAESDMINKATEEISVGQDEAKRAATERAAALGFSRSGGTEEAMQRIDSAAAGDKAAAARDVRIESAKLGFERSMKTGGGSGGGDPQILVGGGNTFKPDPNLWKHHSPSTSTAGAPRPVNKGDAKIIGGGAGNMVPLKGGGWGPAGGGNVNPNPKNSQRPTY